MRASTGDRWRPSVLVLIIVTLTGLLAVLTWANASPPTRPTVTGSATPEPSTTADRPAPGQSGVAVTPPAGQPGSSGILTTPGTVTTPFVQNFGPLASPAAPLASPTAPEAFQVGDGCDHGYGDVNQCVPTRFPPGVTDGCAWLKSHGFGPLVVHGEDRLGLDRNRDGVACGPGD